MFRKSESSLWSSYDLPPVSYGLGAQETRRRLWHFLPGLIALMLPLIPHQEVVRLWVMLIIVAFGIIVPAMLAIRYQHVYTRHQSEDIAPSIFGYVIPLTVLALLFRGTLEIPLAVAAIISFGDGSATLCGLLTRSQRLPWNPKKSVAGLAAFLVMGTLFATFLYWVEASPAVAPWTAFLVVGPVVLVCALVESLPSKVNDNMSVGLVAALLLILQQSLIIGSF